MKLTEAQAADLPSESKNQSSLLQTYLKIVKTGAPHEIDEFS